MRRVAAAVSTAILAVTGVLSLPLPAVAAPAHVGVVVRFASGDVVAGCTSSGGSGIDVLARLHRVTLGSGPYAGFVLEVDNRGTTHPDDTHYWSYWHSAGQGGWTYSGSGAGGYPPKAGSVEGWSYVDGSNDAPRPPSYSYAALCGGRDPAPSSSTPSARRSPTRVTVVAPTTTSAARPAPTAHSVTRAASRPRPAPALPTRSARPAVPSSSRRPVVARTSARPTSAVPSTFIASAEPSTSAPSAAAAPADDRRDSSSGIPAWGTMLALLVIAALGALAWVLARRRRV